MTPEQPRARVVIVSDDRVVLVERLEHGRRYFLFPGTAVEPGEPSQAAAARAARGQLGLDVEVVGIAYEEEFAGAVHTYYYANVLGGAFGAGDAAIEAEGDDLERSGGGSATPTWLPIRQLLAYDVRPVLLARRLDESARRL